MGGVVLGGFVDFVNMLLPLFGVLDAAFGDYIFDFFDWREVVSACSDRLWDAAV